MTHTVSMQEYFAGEARDEWMLSKMNSMQAMVEDVLVEGTLIVTVEDFDSYTDTYMFVIQGVEGAYWGTLDEFITYTETVGA